MEQYGDFAALYDDLMQDIPYDRWAAFIMECTGARRGDTGVDCACGTGSLTVRLSDKGLKMMGVDISESMLEQAAQKARKAAQRIMFICQDIARLCLPKQVSLITCACDGVNYLDNIKKAEAFFSRRIARFVRAALSFLTSVRNINSRMCSTGSSIMRIGRMFPIFGEMNFCLSIGL